MLHREKGSGSRTFPTCKVPTPGHVSPASIPARGWAACYAPQGFLADLLSPCRPDKASVRGRRARPAWQEGPLCHLRRGAQVDSRSPRTRSPPPDAAKPSWPQAGRRKITSPACCQGETQEAHPATLMAGGHSHRCHLVPWGRLCSVWPLSPPSGSNASQGLGAVSGGHWLPAAPAGIPSPFPQGLEPPKGTGSRTAGRGSGLQHPALLPQPQRAPQRVGAAPSRNLTRQEEEKGTNCLLSILLKHFTSVCIIQVNKI